MDEQKKLVYDQKEVKRILWKCDIRLIPFLSVLYLFSFLDRVNIGYTRIFEIEKDLNLTPSQFSSALSIFFLGYILFELPSNLMLKKTSPATWLARIMITWGVITMCFSAVTNYSGLMAARFFLGVFEAGLLPGIVYYLNNWYVRDEQGVRISIFFTASSLAGAFGGLIAYGMAYLHNVGALKAWQWLFIIEGIPTVLLGVLVYFFLPSTVEDAKFLTQREKEILKQRLLESHSEVETAKIDKQQLINALKDFNTYLYMLCYFGIYTPIYSLSLLAPTIISKFGFSPLTTILLTVPAYGIALFITPTVGWNSDRTRDRGTHMIAGAVVAIAGLFIVIFGNSGVVKYVGLLFASIGLNTSLPTSMSWSNSNTIGATKLATVSALTISFGNVGGAISGQFYRLEEAPNFYYSHGANIACMLISIICAFILKYRFKKENDKLILTESTDQDLGALGDGIKGFRYML
ncbi:MFS general substrate transporter [Neoconidiobolus thromboides FSU 785]|nr:MFS general substrate transporter [Neoconidiobolus thromboides FSU 785]